MSIISSFPGYEFKDGKNLYRGTDIGKGGYIISNPGIYENVALLDIAGLHPASIIAMNCFGEHTQRFKEIRDARIFIKHGDFDSARKMLDGKLAQYLNDESVAKDLSQALKIAVNSVYGLTAANFDNPFRDVRNKNNILALRGALFMRTLQDEITDRGFEIVAIKTDSMKIVNATKEIVDFCMEFAKQYGYEFEFEAAYSKICQINDADYVARYAESDWCEKTFGYVPGDCKKHGGQWTVTGARFAVPYVFKKLFSHEEIVFDDFCETFEVKKGALHLDMNENLPEGEEHNYIFVGRVGQFCPIKPGAGGGELVVKRDDKYVSASGAKGYRWKEAETVRELGLQDSIDRSYYDRLVDDAIDAISEYGDFYQFVAEDTPKAPPWFNPDEPWCDERTQFDVR